MADNTTLNTGTGGDVIASDDITGVKFQRVKITLGADGVNDGDVASGNALPVTGTVAVTGVATAANQTTLIGHVDGIEGLLTTIDADTGTLAGAVAGTEMQVDVVAALPAGTNAIGKLAANSGVDIGDVDVTSLPATVHSADYDTGGGTDTTLAFGIAVPASGGAAVVPGDATAGLKVDLGADNDVTVTGTVTANLAAGTNNIGDVDVLSLPALPSGTNNIGDVDVLTMPGTAGEAAALPSVFVVVAGDDGTDTQPVQLSATGDLKITLDSETVQLAASTNNIGDVDVLSIAAGDNNIGNVDIVTVPADPFGVNADAASATGSISAKLRFIAATGIPITSLPAVDTELPAAETPADNLTNATAAPRVNALGYVFDGTTWDRALGNSTDGTLVNLGTNNDVTVTGTVTANLSAGTNTNEVVGDVAHSVGVSGNPVLIAGVAQAHDDTAPPNRVDAESDATRLATDYDGSLFVRPHGPQVWTYHLNTSTAQTDATVHAAPGAGLSLYVGTIVFSSGAATAINMFLEEGASTVIGPYYLEAIAGRGMAVTFNPPRKITANTALTLTTSASIAHAVDITGFTAQG